MSHSDPVQLLGGAVGLQPLPHGGAEVRLRVVRGRPLLLPLQGLLRGEDRADLPRARHTPRESVRPPRKRALRAPLKKCTEKNGLPFNILKVLIPTVLLPVLGAE